MSRWLCLAAATEKSLHDMSTQEQKKGNLRMALVLASIALAFFIGFMIKMFLLSH